MAGKSIDHPEMGKDWMAAVWRDEGEEEWTLAYRFRYYSPDSKDPFDGKDEKKWVTAKGAVSEEKAKSSIDEAMDFLKSQGNLVASPFVPLYSDDPKFCMDQMMKQPWCHSRVMEDPKNGKAE